MIALFLAICSLAPVTEPVSCGKELQFLLIQGLVPESGWSQVPGIPFSPESVFTEVTFHQSSDRSFRVLSTGVTAGLKPSAGSRITKDYYASFLEVSGFRAELWEFDRGTGAGVSYGGAEFQIRNLTGNNPSLLGGYHSERITLAAGEEAFTAGFTLTPAQWVSIGPAWCQDKNTGRFWFVSRINCRPLKISSGGAVTDSTFRRRFTANIDIDYISLTAGTDEEDPVLFLESSAGCCSLSVCLSNPGFHLLFTAADNLTASVSHTEGGQLSGELQVSIRGFVAGITAKREHGNHWETGAVLGISFGSN